MNQKREKRTERNERKSVRKKGPTGRGKNIRTLDKTIPETLDVRSGVRLNRYIAQAGICSRRKADVLIQEGRVKVNNKVVTELGTQVAGRDVVEVNGKRITPLKYEYLLVNKPSDVITTNSDERGRKIILDLIEDEELKKVGVFPVGRLDRNTVGILLVTNDGELAHRLMHPSYNIEKLYIARTKEAVSEEDLFKMKQGITIDGEVYKVDKVDYTDRASQSELGIRLHEGKNRHIRRMLEALGKKTVYLERVRYAGLTTRGVRRGRWRRLEQAEIMRLRRLVKLK